MGISRKNSRVRQGTLGICMKMRWITDTQIDRVAKGWSTLEVLLWNAAGSVLWHTALRQHVNKQYFLPYSEGEHAFGSVLHWVLLIHQRDRAGGCERMQLFLSGRTQRVAVGARRRSCLLCANAGFGPLLSSVQHEWNITGRLQKGKSFCDSSVQMTPLKSNACFTGDFNQPVQFTTEGYF